MNPDKKFKITIRTIISSIADPWNFGVDPDPRICTSYPDPESDPDPAIFVVPGNLQDGNKKLFLSIITFWNYIYLIFRSVADPWHFGVDPDPRIHAS